jgi:pimeloyl-ACP methyl ester carboxylesterase
MPTATVRDIAMHYETEGSGDPLILIPYLSADHACYAFQTPEYSKHFTCVAVDPRGTGTSDKPAGPYSTEQSADDVASLMDVLDIDRAHIAGVSFGAATGMWLAAKVGATTHTLQTLHMLRDATASESPDKFDYVARVPRVERATDGFLLVRHELFHRSANGRIDYDVAPTFVWTLTTLLRSPNLASPAAGALADATPDWLKRFIVRLRECELAAAFRRAHPADAGLTRGWDHAQAGAGPRLSTGQEIERDAAAEPPVAARTGTTPTTRTGAPAPCVWVCRCRIVTPRLGDALPSTGDIDAPTTRSSEKACLRPWPSASTCISSRSRPAFQRRCPAPARLLGRQRDGRAVTASSDPTAGAR